MNRKRILLLKIILFLETEEIFALAKKDQIDDNLFVSYRVDIKKQDIKLYWKDDKNDNFRSIQHLKLWLDKNKRKLVFAMNAGMYKQDNSPLGLFIEKQTT